MYIYIYILEQCWMSLILLVVSWQTKCDIIWRVLNINDTAIIIILYNIP